jgi:hypothetical protein
MTFIANARGVDTLSSRMSPGIVENPHHNWIPTWLREQSLCKIMGEARIHFQVALQNPVRFGVHTSDRMTAISKGLFVDVPKGRDQSLGSFGLIGVWPFGRRTKSDGSFEMTIHGG